MRVLVTGASGFLGSLVARRLVAAGHAVRALLRSTSDPVRLRGLAVERRSGSLAPPVGLDEALEGVDAVVHCAGGGRASKTRSFYVDNTDTTVALLDAAGRASPGPSRFVLVSSLAAQGPSTTAEPASLLAEPRPLTHYGRAKALAEAAVLEQRQQLHVTILRPPALYGPGDLRFLPLFRAARRGLVVLPGTARSTSLASGVDCAEALCALLVSSQPTGRVYAVDDGPAWPVVELAARVGEAVGCRPRTLRVPTPVLWGAALASEGLAVLARREPALTRDKVRDLCGRHWVASSGSLREEIGWRPTTSFGQEAGVIAAAFRERGLLR